MPCLYVAKADSIDWLILVDITNIGDTALYVTRPHAAAAARIVSKLLKFRLPWFKSYILEDKRTLDRCAYGRFVIMVTSDRVTLLYR